MRAIKAVAYQERINGDLIIVYADEALQVPSGWTKIEQYPMWWHRITNPIADVLAAWGHKVRYIVFRGAQ